jgi:hypothetical protein
VKNEIPKGSTSRRCVGETVTPAQLITAANESTAKLKYLKTERTPR